MSKSIAIVGCGGIGVRHAQALGKTMSDWVVYVLDPQERATEQAATLFAESKKSAGSPARIVRSHRYSDLASSLDVAIVATRAGHRLQAIEQLLEASEVRHLILEKFLFSRRDHFLAANGLIARRGMSAWVNCPRRIYPVYRQIATRVQSSPFVHIEVTGSAKIAPLGTIGIHFVDLLQYLCDSRTAPVHLSLKEAQLVPGSRNLDFSGVLEASYGSRGSLRQMSIPGTDGPPVILIVGDTFRYIIEESHQRIYRSCTRNGWQLEIGKFPVPLQSDLSDVVVDELIATGTCGLTPYAASAAVHIAMLDAFMRVYRAIKGDLFLDELPFT
jgi:predicted dehydrogenase